MKGYLFSLLLDQLKNPEKEYFDIVEPLDDDQFAAVCAVLKNNTSLKHLCIDGQPLGDKRAYELAEVLKVNKTLLSFGLLKAQIYDPGLKAITAVLTTHNNTLLALSLGKNEITDKSVPSIVELIKHNKTLKCLNLSGNQLEKRGITEIVRALTTTQNLETVDFSGNRIYTNDSKFLESIRNVLSDKIVNGKPFNFTIGIGRNSKLSNAGFIAIMSIGTGGVAAPVIAAYEAGSALRKHLKKKKYKGKINDGKEEIPLTQDTQNTNSFFQAKKEEEPSLIDFNDKNQGQERTQEVKRQGRS